MKPFEYQILRYVHDKFTSEFANVALLGYLPNEKEVRILILSKYRRISEFFPDSKGSQIIRTLKNINQLVNRWNDRLALQIDLSNTTNIETISKTILPKDDSALQFSNVYYGVTTDLEKTMEDLFQKLVTKYEAFSEKKSRTDEDAKKIVYRTYFNEYGINQRLTKSKLKTKSDEFSFQGWQNGTWNFYKPISFDLLEKESIKDKIYKWAGIADELKTAKDGFNLYLLTLKTDNPKLNKLLHEKVEFQSNSHQLKIILEDEFENFARETKSQIEMSFKN